MSIENENMELSEIGADEIINESNTSKSGNYKIKRTIDEVLDKETGEILKSEDFFKKPEFEIIQYRRRLAETIAGYANPKFVCSYCGQLVKLSGKQTRRGRVDFFAHLYDSDDCEIKTNGEFSKEEIEIRKYANIRESQRHIDLKNEIANALEGCGSEEIGVKNVEIEKRITSDVPYLYWRQPDIFAEFGDKNIVFELQLSTTFLSAIVDRDIFYRLHNTFIVWVFNFSDNQEYVNLGNLMCKDIYYANKRNAFVFDDEARKLSKEEGQLVLLCIWFEPFIENGIFYPEKNVRKQEYIRLSDLKFDDDIYKPYYVDADDMFFKYQPELKVNRINLDELNTNRIKRTEKRKLEKEHLSKKKKDKINELKGQIKNGTTKLQLFSKNAKYGFECNGVTIVEPTYSEATEISAEGYAKVKKNKKYGFLNQFGEFVFDCNYIEAFDICNNKCIVREKTDWCCVDMEKQEQVELGCFDVEKFKYSSNLLKVTYRKTHKEFSGTNRGGYNTYSNVYTDTVCLTSMDGVKINIEFDEIGEFINGKAEAKKYGSGHLGIIDEQGNTIIPFEYSEIGEFIDGKAKARKNYHYGVIDEQNNVIIPFEYSEIGEFIDGKAKVRKGYDYGVIDEQNNIIIPFEYSEIGEFIDGKAKAGKGDWRNKRYGYIDEQGNAIIEVIQEVENGLLIGKKFEKWGIEDKNERIVIPFEYDEICEFADNKIKAKKNGNWGYIDKQGNTIIPFEYSEIGEFVNGKAKAKKNGNWGIIDEEGNTIIPFEYSAIGEFVDGKTKAEKGDWRNKRHGYIDEQGNAIIEVIQEIENGLLIGKKFEKWGVVTKDVETVISFDYKRIEMMRGHFVVIELGKFQLIKQNGLREQIVKCSVNGISNFGVFLEFSGIKGLLHINEIKRAGKNIADFFKGKILNLYILSADANKQRVSFSILPQEKFTLKHKTIEKKSNIDSYVKSSMHIGTITQIVQFGLFIRLEHGVNALLHISELKKHNKLSDNFNVGDNLKVKILNVDKRKNRISVTLF